MSLKLQLLTANPISRTGLESPASGDLLLEQLGILYDRFSSELQENKPQNIGFDLKSRPGKANGNFFRFATVEVKNTKINQMIELIDITVEDTGDNLRFYVTPNFEEFSYDISLYKEDAILRTEALKSIGRALFSLGGEVLLDQEITSIDDLRNSLQGSKFFILRSGLVPDFENRLRELPLNNLSVGMGRLEGSVTDQPFAPSCYNSSDDYTWPGPSPFGRYQRAVARVLFGIADEKDEKKTKYLPSTFIDPLSKLFRRNFLNN